MRSIVAVMLAWAIGAATGVSDFERSRDTRVSLYNGLQHVALGGADIAVDGATLAVRLDGARGGVSVGLRPGEAFNLYLLDPKLEAGARMEGRLALTSANGSAVAILSQHQLDEQDTMVRADFSALASRVTDGAVTVETYLGTRLTSESTYSLDAAFDVGVVRSSEAWAKSWHWVCMDGECFWVVDPEPSATLRSSADDSAAEFNYLVFRLRGVDESLAATAFELTAEGLDEFVVVGEDADLSAPQLFMVAK